MNKLYKLFSFTVLFFCLIPAFTMAQVVHEVNVANVGSGGFTPDALTIVAGDVVRWTNTEGFHSVDGGEAQFPDNPEAFGNDAGGAGWVYEHTFTIAGEYNYWCGVHTQNMVGSISVGATSGVNDLNEIDVLSLYPNPVVSELKWNITDGANIQNAVLNLYDVNGKKVTDIRLASQTSLDVSQYNAGMYFFQIQSGEAILQSGKLLITK